MPLTLGTRLGPYEVLAAIGAGGMGEVYKARDTRLDRVVALKVIHSSVASSPEIRERFDREAKAISALDHPHICTLYDVSRASGPDSVEISFLVMQYLEGETLADRLIRSAKPKSDPNKPASDATTSFSTMARGPIALEVTLKYAAEIADALDAAHRRGIVHRDLKPGNVMLTKSGTKLLDFGLAKIAADEHGGVFGDVTKSQPLTSQGAILGTLHYMSPEQLEGRAVDARSDIFSFGTLIYEMLTGRRPFEGQSQAGIIAGIMGDSPPPLDGFADTRTPLPVVASRALDRLVRKCLAKDPEDRWQSAGDVSDELRWINDERLRGVTDSGVSLPAGGPAAPVSRRRERVWMTVAAAALVALAALAIWWYPRAVPPAEPVSFTIAPPDGQTLSSGPGLVSVSPDGRRIAFTTGSSDTLQIWVREIGGLSPQRLDRTSGAWHPFWSPDSRYLAYTGSGGSAPLRKIDTIGGSPKTLADVAIERGAWGSAGVILFTGEDNKLYRVSEAGGKAELAVDLDAARQETAVTWPVFLPDGKRFVFLGRSADRSKSALFLASLDAPGRTHLVDALSNVDYAAGHLFYQRDGTLSAHPFDERSGRLIGPAMPVVENIRFNAANGRAAFSVSSTGVLAYVAGSNVIDTGPKPITRFDRSHKPLGSIGAPGSFAHAELSPDGRRLVVVEESRQEPLTRTLWLMDVDRGVPTRFTVGTADENSPVWTPDLTAIVFSSVRGQKSGIYRRGAGGGATTEELLLETGEAVAPTGFSPNGDVLLFSRGPGPSRRIWALEMPKPGMVAPAQPAKVTQVFPGATVSESAAVFSPDGKWIAYGMFERGPDSSQVYVQPYPADGRRERISTTSGFNPRWTSDQKQIVYRTLDGTLTSVSLTWVDGTPKPALPQTVFAERKVSRFNWSFSMDRAGQQFVLVVPPATAEEPPPSPITVIVNWTATLGKK